jgi:hypothetical protein
MESEFEFEFIGLVTSHLVRVEVLLDPREPLPEPLARERAARDAAPQRPARREAREPQGLGHRGAGRGARGVGLVGKHEPQGVPQQGLGDQRLQLVPRQREPVRRAGVNDENDSLDGGKGGLGCGCWGWLLIWLLSC